MIALKDRVTSLSWWVLSVLLAAACSGAQGPDSSGPTAPAETPRAAPAATLAPTSPPPEMVEQTPLPDLSTMNVSIVRSTSPDGEWTAEALLAFFIGEMDYARLTLHWEGNDSYREWRPYEEWSESGLGDSFLSDFYWSQDGRHVYFTHRGLTHPCGYLFATNLRRVDLQDGSLVEIPLAGLELGDISISPDVLRMAYRTAEGILVYDLADGSSRVLPHTWPPGYGFWVGGYVWSPDGSELAFTLTEPLCDVLEEPSTSIRVIDLSSGSVRSPGENDAWLYLPARVSADPIPTAALVLHEFLESLYWGGKGGQGEYTYDRAAALYGGSYETLIDMNPEMDPSDHVALLRNACELNGFQCLRLRNVLSSLAVSGEGGAKTVYFTVYLTSPDGGIFALGPCCGEDLGLPQTQFTFTIQESEDGSFRVLELPPYAP